MLTNFAGLSFLPLQLFSFGSGSKFPEVLWTETDLTNFSAPHNLLATCSLFLYIGLLWVKAYLSLHSANREAEGLAENTTITILQPILSGDPFLEEALQHNLCVAPTWANFLWLIDEDDNLARQVTQTLMEKTDKSVRVILCPAVPPRVNPKTFKLQYALSQVKTPYMAVLDDDTLLESNTLGIGLFRLQDEEKDGEQSGEIFTGLPYYLQGLTGWSQLTAHFVNNNSILTYLPFLNFFDPISINGMFYIMRTETLQQMGGFTPILSDLCDDYALARSIKQQGGRIIQGTTPVAIQTSVPDAQSYFRLMHRWFVFAQTLVFDQPASMQALLLLFLGLPPILLWIGLLGSLSSYLVGLWLFVTLMIRYVTIRNLHRRIFVQAVTFAFFPSVASELMQPFHLTHALVNRCIRWRSRLIQVEHNGKFYYHEP